MNKKENTKRVKCYVLNQQFICAHTDQIDIKIKQLKDSYENINDIIELYNIYLYAIYDNNKTIPINENKLMEIVARYFSELTNDNIQAIYCTVCQHYQTEFWELFNKFDKYKNITAEVFVELLKQNSKAISTVIKYKKIVEMYNAALATFMKEYSENTAEILIQQYLEKTDGKIKYYIPKNLDAQYFEEIFKKYISSNEAKIDYLNLIVIGANSKECPLSDKVKLQAKKRIEEMYIHYKQLETVKCYEEKLTISFQPNKQLKQVQFIEGKGIVVIYDVDWIIDNMDYSTLLNNFIYMFEYLDKQALCTFPQLNFSLGIFENIKLKGSNEYILSEGFGKSERLIIETIKMYLKILEERNININDIIKWCFNEYLPTEFGVDIKIDIDNNVSLDSKKLNQIQALCIQMDNILKQFKLYVEDGEVDLELYELSSKPVKFKDVPSMINNKYAYIKQDSNLNEVMNLLFSEQSCLFWGTNCEKEYESFSEIIVQEDICIDEYDGFDKKCIDLMLKEKVLVVDKDKKIRLNTHFVRILKCFYNNRVVGISYLNTNDKKIIDDMFKKGYLRYESTFFNEFESEYFNFMLNKAEFSNGYDLRNKYLHGSYPRDCKQQDNDYFRILILIIVIVLKIVEEFNVTEEI